MVEAHQPPFDVAMGTSADEWYFASRAKETGNVTRISITSGRNFIVYFFKFVFFVFFLLFSFFFFSFFFILGS